MKSERHLLITISAGDERCGFCVYRSVPDRFCTLFAESLTSPIDAKAPIASLRCADCLEAEEQAGGKGGGL